jgi:quercetin dioxygenase-like cupin family protein
MKTSIFTERLRPAYLAASFTAVAALSGVAHASSPSPVKLLTAKFEARQVVQVEAGDFHFKPGQRAPVHTHDAPAVGYVAKGEIIYQVEGEKQQILREGDAFYEPAGPRILRFDNASATEEAIFLDFNLEQKGEPFIVFENKPTEAIDRRTLPTVDLGARSVDQVDIYKSELQPDGIRNLENHGPVLGIVAEGVIELKIEGKATQRVIAGRSFSLTNSDTQVTVENASSEVRAQIVTFRLR